MLNSLEMRAKKLKIFHSEVTKNQSWKIQCLLRNFNDKKVHISKTKKDRYIKVFFS